MSNWRNRFLEPIQDLQKSCPLVMVECVEAGIVGKNRAGEIVVRANGVVNAGLIKRFRETYYRAVKVGILKGEKVNG